MGSEFLSEGSQTEVAPPSYIERFEEACPIYMSMGMSYEDFWYGEPEMPRFFRKAYRLKQEHENNQAWLQGAYVYDAICAVSPVLHAFAKKGTKVQPYLKKPYSMRGEKEKQGESADQISNMQAKFVNIANRFNAQFNKKIKTDETKLAEC